MALKVKATMAWAAVFIWCIFGIAVVPEAASPPADPTILTEEEVLAKVIHTNLQPKLDEHLSFRIASVIVAEAKACNLHPALIAGIIEVESDYRPLITSNVGAAGLMQVHYKWWKDDPILKDSGVNTKDQLYWIELNVKCGVQILSKYLTEANGDIVVALNRYHTGSTALPKGKENHDVNYVNKVMLETYHTLAAMSSLKRQ